MPTYVTREEYFGAAFTILSQEGYRELQIGKLCQLLGVTTGSFYHYFKNREDFVRQFLESWQHDTTERIATIAQHAEDGHERLAVLRSLAQTVPHDAESEIRAWSKLDPAVAAAQRTVDRMRLELIRGAVLNASPHEQEADHLAALALSIVIGMQQMQSPVDLDCLDWALASFIDTVLARAPVQA